VSDALATRDRLATLGEIAAEIAHELQNALQIISASAYVVGVELSQGNTDAAQVHIARVGRSARVAHGIVDDVLALARGDALDEDDALFSELLSASRADLSGVATWQDVVEPSELRVRGRPGLLVRLLCVLYENAIQASAPRPPVIATRAGREAGRVVIEVADDGPGIPEAMAPSVFEPMVTGRAGGNGLGLALARRIVDAHDGSIALVAGGVPGATFRIELPESG